MVLRGPRQVGKTSILAQCVEDLLSSGWPPGNVTYFDFSDERLLRLGSVSPRGVAEHRPPTFSDEHPSVLLLDECTRAEGWAEWLKQEVDRGSRRVVATDSTSALLRRGTRESGVGRWDELLIEGLSYREFLTLQTREGEDHHAVERRLPAAFERYLQRGGFPEHVATESTTLVWRRVRDDIADRAIRRDLAREGVDTERVNYLFQYLLESSGAILDPRKIARILEAGGVRVDPRSVSKWLDLLEQTMLVAPLRRRERSSTGRLRGRSQRRWYAADHGLVMAFAAVVDPAMDPEVRGRAFEAVVFRHLRDHAHRTGASLTYHRKEARSGPEEIDFVVDLDGGRTVAIEVTHSANPRRGKVEEAMRRAKRVGASRALVVFGGHGIEASGVGELVPLRDFVLDVERWIS